VDEFTSPAVPAVTASFESATASLYEPPKYAQLIFLSLSASPMVRTGEGGNMLCVAGEGARKPLGRKPGLVLSSM
jgi:hypothetical protein